MSSNQALVEHVKKHFITLFGPVEGPIQARQLFGSAMISAQASNLIPSFAFNPAYAPRHPLRSQSGTITSALGVGMPPPPPSPAAAAAVPGGASGLTTAVAAPAPAADSTTMNAAALPTPRKRQQTPKYASYMGDKKAKQASQKNKKPKRTQEASTTPSTNSTIVEAPVSPEGMQDALAKKDKKIATLNGNIQKQTELIKLLEKTKQATDEKNGDLISQLNEGKTNHDKLLEDMKIKEEQLDLTEEHLASEKKDHEKLTEDMKHKDEQLALLKEDLKKKKKAHNKLMEDMKREKAEFAEMKKYFKEEKEKRVQEISSLKKDLKKKDKALAAVKEIVDLF